LLKRRKNKTKQKYDDEFHSIKKGFNSQFVNAIID
jgi:hypothetical protein